MSWSEGRAARWHAASNPLAVPERRGLREDGSRGLGDDGTEDSGDAEEDEGSEVHDALPCLVVEIGGPVGTLQRKHGLLAASSSAVPGG